MEIFLAATSVIGVVLLLILLINQQQQKRKAQEADARIRTLEESLVQAITKDQGELLLMLQNSIVSMSNMLAKTQEQVSSMQNQRLVELNEQLTRSQSTLQKTVNEMLGMLHERLNLSISKNETSLEQMRSLVDSKLSAIQQDNEKRLEAMRATVDEKLQRTLEQRIHQSFQLVNERLEQVNKGLGEMHALAAGVGDLKKVLSNVKTRGILGEIQLGAILDQILSPDQYIANAAVVPSSTNVVEYAVKLPGDGTEPVYLPIDAKFPADAYAQLCDAYESADPAAIDAAGSALEKRIRTFAKEISSKYIAPPYTTDFAIMFLPFEGLYAEVVRRGLIERLQNDYHINIAGPTTLSALLNSLQMGFRTLAIQRRSDEVWRVLHSVKAEFDNFEGVLTSARRRIDQVGSELDKLVGVRTRQIQRKLSHVQSLPEQCDQAESEDTTAPLDDE